MIACARSLGRGNARLTRLEGIIDAAREAGLGEPSVDCGLVALASALGMARGGAVALFAIGRTAGWIAHAMEQHRADFLLRPRARYVGPRREAGT
jgi:citrate synthase